MGFFDFLFPPKFEQRSTHTDAIVNQIVRDANGDTVQANRSSVAELCAGAYGRAFALAQVQPMNAVTRALTPRVLQRIGRELILNGEALFEIVFDDGFSLVPVSNYTLETDNLYALEINSPSKTITRYRPGEAVAHMTYAESLNRPWLGESPLATGETSLTLANNLETRLAQETGGTVGHVLPMPDTGGSLDNLQTDVSNLKGRTVLYPSTAGGFGAGTNSAPGADYKPQRLGANPPETLVRLRENVFESIPASVGIPPAMFSSGVDATSAREAYRQFLFSGAQAVAEIASEELREKLDTPDLTLNFDKLFASDIQARARAYAALRGAGMPDADARRVTGLE